MPPDPGVLSPREGSGPQRSSAQRTRPKTRAAQNRSWSTNDSNQAVPTNPKPIQSATFLQKVRVPLERPDSSWFATSLYRSFFCGELGRFLGLRGGLDRLELGQIDLDLGLARDLGH